MATQGPKTTKKLSLQVKTLKTLTTEDLRKVTGGGVFIPTTGRPCRKKKGSH